MSASSAAPSNEDIRKRLKTLSKSLYNWRSELRSGQTRKEAALNDEKRVELEAKVAKAEAEQECLQRRLTTGDMKAEPVQVRVKAEPVEVPQAEPAPVRVKAEPVQVRVKAEPVQVPMKAEPVQVRVKAEPVDVPMPEPVHVPIKGRARPGSREGGGPRR